MIADAEAVSGRKNLIIMVIKDKLTMKELTPELRTYVRTYTYIKATKKTDELMKRIRHFYFYFSRVNRNLVSIVML